MPKSSVESERMAIRDIVCFFSDWNGCGLSISIKGVGGDNSRCGLRCVFFWVFWEGSFFQLWNCVGKVFAECTLVDFRAFLVERL